MHNFERNTIFSKHFISRIVENEAKLLTAQKKIIYLSNVIVNVLPLLNCLRD